MKRNRSWNMEQGLNAERKEDGEKDRGRWIKETGFGTRNTG